MGKLIKAGTPVYIFVALGAGGTGPRQKGTLLTDYERGSTDSQHPQLKTESGEVLRGSECWWIPIEEAEKAENGND